MIEPIDNKGRILTIDGFRCVAVMMVVLYHYYYRFSPPSTEQNFLPYQYETFALIKNGFYGVELFFIISGFVISYTLLKCTSFRDFIVRRFIRLMPALIACSILTFFLIKWFYPVPPFSSEVTYLNFLPSLTFTAPSFWNDMLGRSDIAYVDGVYWSLSVEMLFYFAAGLLYFFRPRAFVSNWLWLSIALLAIRLSTSPKTHFLFPPMMHSLLDQIYHFYIIYHLSYWVYFALGIFFHSLYRSNKPQSFTQLILVVVLALAQIYFLDNIVLRILFVAFIALFLMLIYRVQWLFILRWRPVVWIGIISYPIYLLHENLGLMLINKISRAIDVAELDKYMPLFAIAVILIASNLIFKFVERPAMAFLKSRFSAVKETEIISSNAENG